GHRVEPAAASRTSGRRSVLVPGFADALADRVLLLGRERSFADARGVGLRDPDDAVDLPRREAGARGDPVRPRARGGHERIGPRVEVEQRALRALEDHALAG